MSWCEKVSVSIYLLLYLVFGGIASSDAEKTTSSAIPELLFDCYRNNLTITSRPPLTVSLLVELIRKIELDDSNALNLRILVTSILHGVVFDGVRRSPRTYDDEFGVPYRATGEQFNKYRLLVDYLTSGESSLFPTGSLTTPEFCFLHELISNTVDPWERGDESSTCTRQSSMPMNLEVMSDDDKMSSCPIKKGNVLTKWGTISPGHIIAGIAAGLQQSVVSFQRIEDAISSKGNKTNDLEPRTRDDHNTVNAVWVSAIVADLAEVILQQATTLLEFGMDGFWNDTLLPRVFYLESEKWLLTEAEILGGIDALIISNNVQKWYESNKRMRLSQLIDMYYSDRGMVYDNQYKASSRSTALNKLLEEINFEDQIIGTARLLQGLHSYEQYLRENELAQLASIITEKFKQLAGNITKKYDSVEYIYDKQKMKSPIELIVILDGIYDLYAVQQIIYTLSEAIQVSRYGSKIGVINGQSGNWLARVTGESFQLFSDLNQAEKDWPRGLSLGRSLETVMFYYENRTTSDCSKGVMKPSAQSVLIMTANDRLTDNDLTRSRRAFNSIKNSNPEVTFVLATPSGSSDMSSNFWDNDFVLKLQNNVLSFVENVAAKLSQIPGNIINFYCNQSQIRLEDYITPNVDSFYQIRKEYVEKGHIKTNFSNSNYGILSICVISDTVNQKICKEVTVNGEISFDSRELCADSVCNLEYTVSVKDSKNLCIENDCRYPDQVRMNIYWEHSSGNTVRASLSLMLIYIVSYLLSNNHIVANKNVYILC